jgi:hypothetical protein
LLGYIAHVATTSTRPSKRSLIAAVALVVWVLVLVFGWALRPIEDTVPVVVDPTSELAVILAETPSLTPADAERGQLVQCNSLVDSAPRDLAEPLPPLRPDYVYERVPCDGPHAGARLAAAVNALAVIAMIAGWIFISRRVRTDPPTRAPEPEPATP